MEEQDVISQLVNQAAELGQMYALGQLPDSPHYLANAYHRHQMSVHFRWQHGPGDLIATMRPNEDDYGMWYRGQNYEQNTFSVGFSVVNALKGTLSNPQVFSVRYADRPPTEINQAAGEDLATYLTTQAAVPGKDMVRYFWDFIAIQSLLDPNGYVVLINQKSDQEVQQLKDEGTIRGDLAQWRNPRPFFIPSTHVLHEGHDYAFVMSTESTVITVKKQDYTIPVFWYFTEDITFKLEAISGQMVKNPETRKEELVVNFDVIVWDHHSSGIAAKKPRGIISDERVWKNASGQMERHVTVMEMDDVGFFLSILALAVPDWNRAIRILSDLSAGLVSSLYPIRTVEIQKCPNDGCVDGYLEHPEDPDGQIACPTCGGKGYTFPTGPMAAVAKQPNESGAIMPAVVWSGPPTDSFNFAWQMHGEAILAGLKAVAHGSLREASGNSQDTARRKELDLAQQHIIAREVGAIWYPLLQWYLDKANDLRYGKLLDQSKLQMNRATVVEPATLDITMITDLFEQIKQMQESSMPVAIRKMWASRALARDIGTSSPQGQLGQTYLNIDTYALMNQDEIMTMQARYFDAGPDVQLGIMADQYIHDHMEALVQALIKKSSEQAVPVDFLGLPAYAQKMMAQEMAKEIIQADGVVRRRIEDRISGAPADGAIDAPESTEGSQGASTSEGQEPGQEPPQNGQQQSETEPTT